MTTIIKIDQIKKRFGKQQVLNHVSLSVEQGTIYSLLGANGAGKSTLLKIMTGLLPADGGDVEIEHHHLPKDLLTIQRRFSYSGQQSSIDDVLTGMENLTLVAKLRHLPQSKVVAQDLLARFSLTDAANKAAGSYSGGMARRLDLAMSLVGDPEIIFLDEPTTGLDPASRNDLWTMIRELKAKGKTIFLTTQYIEEADQLADRIGFLRDGEIIATGTPAEMKQLAGAEKLKLIFKNDADSLVAQKILETAQVTVLDPVTLVVTLSAGNHQSLAILKQLADAEVPIDNFGLVSPTLDDVFMKLTKGVTQG
ncbi:ABC transporter, ATP-binding protein [Lapidilactobacillus concavus DSM 17758]|uniref:ABC transporter, ATP-binding protein n=1 Tax=Lapidilactobacillus concavus DSM 17758 TaxID=1423735 RepID=A0A0R1W874_9LACO|nr:ABC transporter ATP-binding protein [Lapidilactobacillus concavus]KRM13727.1 ABC transporter, ATP-binding protein [Lapidilactobacillus concavus DSM 17758]GEL12607.1 daunorubicin resistance protein DrrA family ABC transporter ATP-binding protein [Lapidilactobacillus concavus]